MKKLLAAVLLAAVTTLSGCSSVGIKDGAVTLKKADIRISFPEGFSVVTGSEMYKRLAEKSGGEYADGAELKKECKQSGQEYLALAETEDGSVVCTVSAYDTVNSDGDEITASELARVTHDSTIFGYLAGGFSTGDNSSFTESTAAGKSAWISHFELLTGEGGEFVLGQTEYTISSDDKIYSVQVVYSSENSRNTAENILIASA